MNAKRYTKFDSRSAYNAFRMKNNEWKTAFRCRFGHFEYKIMFFGLINAPATFQNYINMVLQKYLDIFVILYLDDILIYSMNKTNYVQDVRLVPEKLK